MRPYQLWERVLVHLEENKAAYLFTVVLFLMGIIFGAIVVNSLSLSQKQDLHIYLNQFFSRVDRGEIAEPVAMFAQSFMHYAKYFGLMWLLGLSIIGLPIVLILLFLKGIVVGFTVGFLVNQMGTSGFFLSFLAIMPQNLILVPAFIVIGASSITFFLKMIRYQFIRKHHIPLMPHLLRHSLLLLCIGGALVFASAFEAYVSPVLMKIVL